MILGKDGGWPFHIKIQCQLQMGGVRPPPPPPVHLCENCVASISTLGVSNINDNLG
jgi:hypothetical protein